MGPLATIDFLGKIIALTPAKYDQQHVPLIVHQVPQIPDRSQAILCGSDAPFAPMLQGLRRLAAADAAFAVIPCNTAHHWFDRLSSAQSLRLLHIADATRAELARRELSLERVAVLATRGTLASDVYGRRLTGRMRPAIQVDRATQGLVDDAIAATKAGCSGDASALADDAVRRTLAAGAHAVILACTELPVALARSALLPHCVDTTLALARYCVAASRGAVSVPEHSHHAEP